MARLLLRLRLRLLGNSLQLSTQHALGIVFGSLFGLGAGVIVAGILTASATDPNWTDVATTFLAVLWIGWIVLPAISFNSDITLDPRRFATFPLTARQLVPGLFVAALVGIGPAASLIAASGVVLGASRLGGPIVIAVAGLAVLGSVATCVAWSRALLAIASDLLSSRRGREVAATLAMLLMVAIVLGPQLTTHVAFRPDQGQLSTIAAVAAWTPGGMGGGAISAALDDHLGVAALWLAGLAGSTVVALAIWAAAIRRSQSVAPVSAATSRGASSLYPRLFAFLPRNRVTAVAVRFLRTLVRDTRVRMQVLSYTWVMVPLFVFSASAIPGPTAPLYASYLVILFGLLAANQLGLDGPALWQHELAGADPVRDLLGRNLGLALLGMPIAAIGSVALAVTFDAWGSVPAALLLSLAVLLVLLGTSNAAAVLAPFPIPEDPTNIFGGGSAGSGFVQGVMALMVFIVQGVLVAPVFLATMLLGAPGPRLVAAATSVVYGAAVLIGGTLLGAARARGRGPELLAAVDPRGA